MLKLVCQSSKFSFFLMLIISLPIFLETPFLLGIWLKEIPDYTIIFTRLVIINALIDVLANPLASAMQAYGKIRNYHLVCGGFILTILPISYVLLRLGFPPESAFYVSIVISAFAIFLRLIFVHYCIGLSLRAYFLNVLLPAITVALIASVIPCVLEAQIANTIVRFFVVILTSVLTTSLSVAIIGLNKSERQHVLSEIRNKLKIF